MLNVNPAVVELTEMVPVATVQEGCAVTVAVGATGVRGCGFTVTGVMLLMQALEFLAVTL